MRKIAIIFLLLSAACRAPGQAPKSENGRVDLRSTTLPQNTIEMVGHWHFCPDTLLSEADFKDGAPEDCSLQKIPGPWTAYKLKQGKMPGTGVATYRTTIQLPENARAMGLFMPYQGTAYRLWINGKIMASNGVVSLNPEERQAAMKPEIIRLPNSPEIHLLIQISNEHDKTGGMWHAPRIGSLEAAEDYLHRSLLIDSLMAGMLLLAASFSFLLFALNRDDRAAMYFGLFAVFALLRQISTNSHPILLVFPDLPFNIYYRFEYLGILLSPAAFLHSLNQIFPGTIHRYALRGITAVFLVFGFVVLTLPPALFSQINPTNHLFLLATLLVSGRSIYLGRKIQMVSAGLIGAGFVALAFFTVHDILVELNLIQSPYLVSLGLLVFLMGHVAALAHGAARARQEQVRISASLTAAEVLSNVARSLIGCDSPGTIALNLYRSLRESFKLERLSLYIPFEEAIYAAPFAETIRSELSLDQSNLLELKDACSPDDDAPRLRTWPDPYDLPSSLCVPVREGDSLKCVIFLQRAATHPFSQNTRDILQSLTPYVLLALRNANMVADLVNANQRSFRQTEFQRIVLSVLSHDLRGPLSTSYTFLDHLSRNKETLGGRELDLLRGGIQDAMDLLQRLLEWARASASEQQGTSEANVRDCLERVYGDIQFRGEQKGVTLILEPPEQDCFVAIEPHSLEVVVRNIAMNAIKYTGMGGNVKIHTRKDAHSIRIQVDDTGVGMSAERARELLDTSRRLQSRVGTEGEKGAGLGMYLSQLLLTAAGGFISVDTDRPVGTRFEVELPISSIRKSGLESETASEDDYALEEPDVGAAEGSTAQSIRVLHIEDSDLLANLVERFLDGDQYHLDRARTAQEAEQKFLQYRYDIILADIELEGENGARVVQRLLTDSHGPPPPVIAVTAHDYESIRESLEAGLFDSYLQKPFTKKDLRTKMEKVLAGIMD